MSRIGSCHHLSVATNMTNKVLLNLIGKWKHFMHIGILVSKYSQRKYFLKMAKHFSLNYKKNQFKFQNYFQYSLHYVKVKEQSFFSAILFF